MKRFTTVAALVLVVACKSSSPASDAGAAPSSAPPVDAAPSTLQRNQTLLATLDVAHEARWTPSYQLAWYKLGSIPLDACKASPATCDAAKFECSDVTAIAHRATKDEFERKQRDEELARALDPCVAKMRTAIGPLPSLSWLSFAVTASAYDFDTGRFPLLSVTASAPFMEVDWNGGDLVAGAEGQVARCGAGSTLASESGILAVYHVSMDDFRSRESLVPDPRILVDRRGVAVMLPIDRAKAPDVRARLDRDEENRQKFNQLERDADAGEVAGKLLRVDVAFEPRPYGQIAKTCNYTANGMAIGGAPLHGFEGRAIGYRIVDGDGVLLAWQAFAR
jgi:hypothetical protein